MGYLDDLLYQEQAITDNLNNTLTGKADIKTAYIDAAGIQKKRDLGIFDDLVPKSVRRDSFAENQYYGNGIYRRVGSGPINDLSLEQMSTLEDQAYRERGVLRDDTGMKYKINEENGQRQYLKDQGQNTAFLYDGMGKGEDGSNYEKIGKARYGVEPRYQEGLAEEMGLREPGSSPYGWPSGELGIDETTATEKEFEGNTADRLESLKHNNINYLNARIHMDDGSNLSAARRSLLGDGASEYYDSSMLPGRTPPGELPADQGPGTDQYNNALEAVLGKSSDMAYTPGTTYDGTTGLSEYDKYLLRSEQTQAGEAGWTGKDIKEMNAQEFKEYEKIRNNDQLSQGYFSDDGLMTTFAKKLGSYGTSAAFSLADLGGETAASLMESIINVGGEPMTPKEQDYIKKVEDFFNVPANQKNWEKSMGVNNKFSQKAHAELEEYVANEDYTGAFGSVIDNFGSYMADSLPEMMSMVNMPLFVSAINKRVQEQSVAFEAKAGRKPTNAETALMASLNFAILGFEKLALVPGLKAPFQTLLNVTMNKVAGQSASIIGQIVRSTGAAALATVGEGIQEPLDQLNENFWKKGGSGVDYKDDASPQENIEAFSKASWEKLQSGEVLSKKEAIGAGIAGVGIGSVLSGGQNAVTGTIKGHGINQRNNRVTASGNSAQDASFSRTDATQAHRENTINDLQYQIDSLEGVDINENFANDPEFMKMEQDVKNKFGEDYDLNTPRVQSYVRKKLDKVVESAELELKTTQREFDAAREEVVKKEDARKVIEETYEGDMDELAKDLSETSQSDETASSKIKDLFSTLANTGNNISTTINDSLRALNSTELQQVLDSSNANAEIKAKAKYLIAKRKQENAKTGAANYLEDRNLGNQGNIANTFEALNRVLGELMGKKEIVDSREVNTGNMIIDQLLENGHISETQAQSYRNRLQSASKNAQNITEENANKTTIIDEEAMATQIMSEVSLIEQAKTALGAETDPDLKKTMKAEIKKRSKNLADMMKASSGFTSDPFRYNYNTNEEAEVEPETTEEAEPEVEPESTPEVEPEPIEETEPETEPVVEPEPEVTPEPEPEVDPEEPMSTADQFEKGFEELTGGAETAMRQRVADELGSGETIEYNNEAAIDAAIANPDYEIEVTTNDEGKRTAKVIGVRDADGNWVASKEITDKIEADRKKAEDKVSEDEAVSEEDQTDSHSVENQGETQEARDAANRAANLFNCN